MLYSDGLQVLVGRSAITGFENTNKMKFGIKRRTGNAFNSDVLSKMNINKVF